MGQAKNRGTFEERRAEAVKAGRVKHETKRKPSVTHRGITGFDPALWAPITLAMMARSRRNKGVVVSKSKNKEGGGSR